MTTSDDHRVTHDALPTHLFPCDGLDTATWNGWAVPFWRSGEVCADVADFILGEDGRALFDGENDVVLIDYWLSEDDQLIWSSDRAPDGTGALEESETVGRDNDGMFRLHGWTFTAPA